MKKLSIFFLILVGIIAFSFSFDGLFEPSPFGVGTGYTYTIFQFSPTIGLYIPGGSFPPSAAFSKVNYTVDNGNFREFLYNKNANLSENNFFKGMKSTSLVAAYGNFSIFKISLDNLFVRYNSDNEYYNLKGFKGDIYGLTYYKRSGNFQYGVSLKRYDGRFYFGNISSAEYFRNYGDLYNFFLETRDELNPVMNKDKSSDKLSFYTLESSLSLAVYRSFYISLKISPLNKVKIEELDKTLPSRYEGGATFILSRSTSFNFSIYLKSIEDFYSGDLKQPIAFSMIHFFSNISFITLGWRSNLKASHLFSAEYESVLSGGVGYVFGNTVYTYVSGAISSWNKLSSFNITIAYISHTFK